MPSQQHFDVLILGGGVVGLSLAYELSGRGAKVCVADRAKAGREASWAGAGITPPGSWYHPHSSLEALAALSSEFMPNLCARLHQETGLSTGWKQSGGIYLPGNHDWNEQCDATFARWRISAVKVRQLSSAEARNLEPNLAELECCDSHTGTTYFVSHESQLRNPRFLRALVAGCRQRKTAILEDTAVTGFITKGNQIEGVHADCGTLLAEHTCLTAGCWSGGLALQLGLKLPIRPVRGQIALLRHEQADGYRATIHRNGMYLVSRGDGLSLVGSTLEEVGFEKSCTAAARQEFISFANEVGLGSFEVERQWSGLRPATEDGLPFIGRLPGYTNGWIAAGHFRSGLQMAPATAAVVAALIQEKPVPVDVEPFSVERTQVVGC